MTSASQRALRVAPSLLAAIACSFLVSSCTTASQKTDAGDTVTETSSFASPTPSPTEAAATATPEPGDFPALTPFSTELEQQLREIRTTVASIRGLPVHPTAEEGYVSREALAAYGRDQFAALEGEDATDAAASEAMMRLMGLIPPDYTFETLSGEFANVIAGVYYFEVDRLVLVGEDIEQLSVSDELTLAHEYVHSFQDARFNLDSFITKWTESAAEVDGYASYSETLRCLIEGDAEVAQRLYAEQQYGPDWRELASADGADDAPIEFDIPDFILNSFGFYYTDCVYFVETLYDEGGWAAVNAAYENPPGTTEQILDIAKYREGELAGVPKPESLDGRLVGWTEVDAGQFGQYDIYNYVISLTDEFFEALLAASGWNSGWLRLYQNDADPARIITEVRLAWDPEVGTEAFTDAFEAVLASQDAAPSSGLSGVERYRWNTPDARQYGLYANEDGVSVRIIFASDDAAIDALLAAEPS